MSETWSAAASPAVPGPAVPGPAVPGPAVPGPAVPGPAVPVLAPRTIVLLDDDPGDGTGDPALIVLTCASCGAPMDERKCKLICRCGYFLSCSDYY